jgi:hypothetical protein
MHVPRHSFSIYTTAKWPQYVKQSNQRDLMVKADVQSSLHLFQGKWHCTMQHVLASHDMLPSTTVTAAWSLAMRSFDCPESDSIIRCPHMKKSIWVTPNEQGGHATTPPCQIHLTACYIHTHQTSFHRSIMLKPQTLPQSFYISKQSWHKSFQRTMISLGCQPVS